MPRNCDFGEFLYIKKIDKTDDENMSFMARSAEEENIIGLPEGGVLYPPREGGNDPDPPLKGVG